MFNRRAFNFVNIHSPSPIYITMKYVISEMFTGFEFRLGIDGHMKRKFTQKIKEIKFKKLLKRWRS